VSDNFITRHASRVTRHDSKNWYYRELSNIYEESKRYIHKVSVNPCKECFRCCSVEAKLGIYMLEYDYIEEFLHESSVSEGRVKFFKDYINKKKKDGNFIYHVCPFYNNHACSIYPARPMSCRLYPYFSTKEDICFEDCNLKSVVQLLTVENIRNKLPFLERYYFLINLYNGYFFNKFRLF